MSNEELSRQLNNIDIQLRHGLLAVEKRCKNLWMGIADHFPITNSLGKQWMAHQEYINAKLMAPVLQKSILSGNTAISLKKKRWMNTEPVRNSYKQKRPVHFGDQLTTFGTKLAWIEHLQARLLGHSYQAYWQYTLRLLCPGPTTRTSPLGPTY
eukprot:1691200-Ditylum_brightwellii.AAC.1